MLGLVAASLIKVRADVDLIKLRLEVQLGEVRVDSELVFSEAVRVRLKLLGEVRGVHLVSVVEKVRCSELLRPLSLINGVVQDFVVLNLGVGLSDHRILDHFASKLKIFFTCLVGDLIQLLLHILHVVAKELLLLRLPILLLKGHTFVDLGTTVPIWSPRIVAADLK